MFANAAAVQSYLATLATAADDGGAVTAFLDRVSCVVRLPSSSQDHQGCWRYFGLHAMSEDDQAEVIACFHQVLERFRPRRRVAA